MDNTQCIYIILQQKTRYNNIQYDNYNRKDFHKLNEFNLVNAFVLYKFELRN